MKVAVTIKGFIDIPDTWSVPREDQNFPLDVADYHFNEKLNADDAIDALASGLKEYQDDFEVDFSWPETHRTTNHPSKPLLDSSESESERPTQRRKKEIWLK